MTNYLPISGGQMRGILLDKNGDEVLGGGGSGIEDLDDLGVTASAAELNILDGATLSTTELNYVDGVTSALQTQLNAKQPLDSDLTTIAGLTATTDNFIVSVSSAWDSRTPAQVKTTLSLNNVDNTSDATKNAATVTLTNKRITARVQSVSDAATVTPNADSDDCVDITAIAQAFTIANPSGTPTNFQKLIIRILDNSTARAITWGNGYAAGGAALPSTTTLGKITTVGLIYDTANSLNKWLCVAVSTQT